MGEDVARSAPGMGPDDLASLRALAVVFLGRLSRDTLSDAIR
ncbi:hypothetical protein [Nocardiopsis sp. NRRL B-16309]|nr:hypothetical protein [Nocardiopsis sp. NRRL B-16309]